MSYYLTSLWLHSVTVGFNVLLTLHFHFQTIAQFVCVRALWDCSVLMMLSDTRAHWYTWHFHNVSRNKLSGFDHLYALSVSAVDFSHLWLILLQSLNGALRIALLWKQSSWSVPAPLRILHLDVTYQGFAYFPNDCCVKLYGPLMKPDQSLVFFPPDICEYSCA